MHEGSTDELRGGTVASRGKREGRGFFERFLFSFMGPPEIGDLNAPPRELPPGPVARCTKCGLPYDEHEIVRDPGLTYTRCPASPVVL